MENYWLILVLAIVALGFAISFFIKQNLEANKTLKQKLKEDDEISILVDYDIGA